jgi:hypothetical protein
MRRAAVGPVISAMSAFVLFSPGDGATEPFAKASQRYVPTLTRAASRYYVRRLIRQRAGAAYAERGYYRIRCNRISRLRFSCRFSAFAGDSYITGGGYVRYSHDFYDDEVHYRFRVVYTDDYCQSVTHGQHCQRRASWSN